LLVGLGNNVRGFGFGHGLRPTSRGAVCGVNILPIKGEDVCLRIEPRNEPIVSCFHRNEWEMLDVRGAGKVIRSLSPNTPVVSGYEMQPHSLAIPSFSRYLLSHPEVIEGRAERKIARKRKLVSVIHDFYLA
jgi:hypothetical protein